MNKGKIWFTSDTHYSHKNLVDSCSEWTDKGRCRKFRSLSEHDDFIVNSINSLVSYEDTLYHLGDWSFGGFQNIRKFRERINCQTVHLVLGNHDEHVEKNTDSCRDVFSSVNYYLELKLNGHFIILSHWPMKIWNKSHKGSWQLHGHCHNNLQPDEWWTKSKRDERRRTMDVGMDTNDLKPWSFEEIEKIMSKLDKYPSGLDHHEKD
jgi:calcineurin-like phosphoesterase family protein